jgi:hypothetical protein
MFIWCDNKLNYTVFLNWYPGNNQLFVIHFHIEKYCIYFISYSNYIEDG